MESLEYNELSIEAKSIIDSFDENTTNPYNECERIRLELLAIGYDSDFDLSGELIYVVKIEPVVIYCNQTGNKLHEFTCSVVGGKVHVKCNSKNAPFKSATYKLSTFTKPIMQELEFRIVGRIYSYMLRTKAYLNA